MENSSAQVTISVKGGPSEVIPWRENMTALSALEEAFGLINQREQFTFALQYYGSEYDYLVIMINETYDSFISKGGSIAKPFYYWAFKINGTPAQHGISNTILSENDVVEFEFTMFEMEQHQGTEIAAKYAFQTGGR